MKTKTIDELAKIEALRTKKAGRVKKTAPVEVKREVENHHSPRVGRPKDLQKKSASKNLSRKKVDAKKEEKESLLT